MCRASILLIGILKAPITIEYAARLGQFGPLRGETVLQNDSANFLHAIFDPAARSPRARAFRIVYNVVLAIGVGAVIFGSSQEIYAQWGGMLSLAAMFASTFFCVEYLLRLTAATMALPAHDGVSSARLRWRWMTSPQGLIDLAAAVPFLLILFNDAANAVTHLFIIFWAFKLFRYAPGALVLGRVFRFAWQPLFSVFITFIVILLMAATLIHLLEGTAQPATYGSIPLSLWWTIVTLTTTGYGDVTPITPLGRMLAGTVMVCGIGVFALWAGILANAFANELRRSEFLRNWDLVTQVPMFHDLCKETIADISRVLRARDYSSGDRIFRSDEQGDCMYFIVSGAVEVRMSPAPVILNPGQFFGEIALITGEPRTATTVAIRETQLLILDIADFREVAARRPELSKAINDEAMLRQAAFHRPSAKTP